MAKQKAKRRKPAKKKTELAKRDKPEDSEILGTMNSNGKMVNIKKWHISGVSIPPEGMLDDETLNEKGKEIFKLKFAAVKAALKSKSKDLQNEAIDEMLGDLVAGAYQDKIIAYARVPSGDSRNSFETYNSIIKARQSADTHLLTILKAVRDIKRPPVSVIVKEAQQVNVADQINQADKQVNIAKNQQS